MRKQIAAANWKMNLTLQQADALVNELLATPHNLGENQQAVFGVPFPYLISVKNKLDGKKNIF
ncbi:MAG TPA: triose-phosphate isomerase, partial [Ferruginibacter sp.]|nr:triose-phosphate isomerase [Ferruginibacter sp.]